MKCPQCQSDEINYSMKCDDDGMMHSYAECQQCSFQWERETEPADNETCDTSHIISGNIKTDNPTLRIKRENKTMISIVLAIIAGWAIFCTWLTIYGKTNLLNSIAIFFILLVFLDIPGQIFVATLPLRWRKRNLSSDDYQKICSKTSHNFFRRCMAIPISIKVFIALEIVIEGIILGVIWFSQESVSSFAFIFQFRTACIILAFVYMPSRVSTLLLKPKKIKPRKPKKEKPIKNNILKHWWEIIENAGCVKKASKYPNIPNVTDVSNTPDNPNISDASETSDAPTTEPQYRKFIPRTGLEYEAYVARQLRLEGYTRVVVTQASGDHGADILAFTPRGESAAIQCKFLQSSVGQHAVQEAVSARIYYNREVAIVITNSTFTRGAKDFAANTDTVLIENYI